MKFRFSLVTAIAYIAFTVITRVHAESLQSRVAQAFEAKQTPTVLTNISYVRGDHDAHHMLDLYLPKRQKNAQPVPLVVWIHGGGYSMGDKQGAPAFLTDYGYAVASLNYRFSSEAHYPAQIWDCKTAVRFLRLNAAKYNIDPSRIGVWGHSSGGHLAALLGTTFGVKELEGRSLGSTDECSRVQAVVDWCGLSDLESLDKQVDKNSRIDAKTGQGVVGQLLGGVPSKHKRLEDQASPITYASGNTPPFLIMHGDRDNIVPIAQSQELFGALRSHGTTVDMQVVKGGRHDFLNSSTVTVVRQFFDKWLKTAPVHACHKCSSAHCHC